MISKITIKKNWQVTQTQRINIVGATYRQALSYINHLRLRGIKDILVKPLEV